jgi:hypothetical protein
MAVASLRTRWAWELDLVLHKGIRSATLIADDRIVRSHLDQSFLVTFVSNLQE